MRNKNTIVALLIVFAVICLYNLYWTYVQFDEQSDRAEYQAVLNDFSDVPPDSLSEAERLDLDRAQEYFGPAAGNVERYERAVDNSFTLGLDLQGGMFVTLEVVIEDVLTQLAGSSADDPNFQRALLDARRKAQSQERPYVDLFIESLDEIDANANYGAIFQNRARGIGPQSQKEQVVDMLRQEAVDAVDRTFEIIRKRVDQFGVVSPNLQKQGVAGRILLELPGVKEPERVREILRSTARLEFWETYTVQDAFPVLNDINERLRVDLGIVEDSTELDSTEAALADVDPNDSTAIADADSVVADTTTDLADLLGDDDESGVTEASDEEVEEFRRNNPLFRYLQPPSNGVEATSPIVGYALSSDTGRVNQILRDPSVQSLVPDDMEFAWTFKPIDEEANSNVFVLLALRTSANDSAALDGGVITNASQDFDERGRAVVSMEMNQLGAAEWKRITGANVGRSVAIALDGKVYSYPTVQDEIGGGRSQISGNFQVKEAQDLATVLKAGQLPVTTRIESEDVVGPTLGAENIRSSYISFIAAFIVTMIFMAFYYNKAGLMADLALLANLFFIMGCAAAFSIVLTLPGVAAIVLTVGMAVDANVLIFERIREEMAKGKTLKASIKSGFQNAFSSVMDANVTTFLTGVVLYVFGIGPIRGFAVTLMIGIVTSLISALIITRLILDYYANRGGQSIRFGSDATTGLFDRIKINMVDRRRTFYMVSLGAMAVSVILMITVGFKTGVDLNGGRQFTVRFGETEQVDQSIDLTDGQVSDISQNLLVQFDNLAPTVKTLSQDNKLQITTSYLADQIGEVGEGAQSATDEVLSRLKAGLEASGYTDGQYEIESSFMVGPTLANDIRDAAFYAIIFSLVIIFLYILIRFRGWQFSLGGVAALFHDVVIVLGIFSFLKLIDPAFFNVEIDQAMIAALLTIIGYSINDTVVVFDRIRENLGEMKSSSRSAVYDVSIDQTLSRTVITSLTTFLTAFILFVFGGYTIKGFVFAIMIGVIVGTYSSVFVASPISLDAPQWFGRKAVEEIKSETADRKQKRAR